MARLWHSQLQYQQEKEENMKNAKNSFVIKPVENRLKIDSYKPTMLKDINRTSNPSKKIRSLSRKKQSELSKTTTIEIPVRSEKKKNTNFLEPLNTQDTNKAQKQLNEKNKVGSRKQVVQNSAKHTKQNFKTTICSVPSSSNIEEPVQGFFNIEYLHKDFQQIKILFEDLISLMEKKSMLSINADFIRIKKERLICFITFLSQYLLSLKLKTSLNFNHCKNLTNQMLTKFEDIEILATNMAHQKKVSKLNISSKLVDKTITFANLEAKKQEINKKISDLIENENAINKIVKQLKSQVRQVSQKSQTLKIEVFESEQYLFRMKLEADNIQAKKILLEEKIAELTNTINQLEEKGKEMLHFVENQQQRPFLHEVSKKYKYTETVMFDFVYEMNVRPDMSSYEWQPQPFEAMEKFMKDDLKHVLETINCNHISLQEKVKEMKEFVLGSYRKFNRKDKDLMKLVRSKTNAVNRCASIIRKWYDQYCMKNEYLGSMRKEYAVDSAVVTKCINELEHIEQLQEGQKQCIAELKKYWEWCDLAYKYGNSFY